MKKITLEDLRKALEKSWSKKTAYKYKKGILYLLNTNQSSLGQCCVTALIVQDYFGGQLKTALIKIIGWHTWNQLPGGLEIDLTKSQFSKDVIIPPGKIRAREYFLSYPDTVKRYKILKRRVEKYLKEAR